MFHDVGKLGVLYCLGSLILREEFDFEVSFLATVNLLDDLHVALGRAMLLHWNMPDWLINLRHLRSEAFDASNPEHRQAKAAALVASLMCQMR